MSSLSFPSGTGRCCQMAWCFFQLPTMDPGLPRTTSLVRICKKLNWLKPLAKGALHGDITIALPVHVGPDLSGCGWHGGLRSLHALRHRGQGDDWPCCAGVLCHGCCVIPAGCSMLCRVWATCPAWALPTCSPTCPWVSWGPSSLTGLCSLSTSLVVCCGLCLEPLPGLHVQPSHL